MFMEVGKCVNKESSVEGEPNLVGLHIGAKRPSRLDCIAATIYPVSAMSVSKKRLLDLLRVKPQLSLDQRGPSIQMFC